MIWFLYLNTFLFQITFIYLALFITKKIRLIENHSVDINLILNEKILKLEAKNKNIESYLSNVNVSIYELMKGK